MQFLMFSGGLLTLITGANLLVRGASKLSLSFDISTLVVGLTVNQLCRSTNTSNLDCFLIDCSKVVPERTLICR